MKGLLGLAAVCLLVAITEAQITGWTQNGFTVTAGTGTASVTMKYDTKVVETSAAAAVIVTLAATKTGAGTVNYAFTATGNPNSVGTIATTGAITLATGKSIDYETTKSIVFVVTATESGAAAGAAVGTATVTVEIKNKVEYSQAQYGVCANDGATAGTTIGTFKVADAATDDTIAYTSTLSGASELKYDGTTGVLSVNTGKTLDQKTLGGYEITLTATPSGGSSDTTAATTKLWVAVATCSSGAMHVTAMFAVVAVTFAAALLI